MSSTSFWIEHDILWINIFEGSLATIIEKHPYVKFRREIDHINFVQRNIEEDFYVYLYKHKVVSDEQEFPIETVFDMSYKMLSGMYGFLYLHTTKGVFTYQIKDRPDTFIAAFREVEVK
ncbi:hypothetical protein [Halalkalibacillus halophilus]|uniref:hypothetical protein n=1 Tax=Halalkalibacillus halophilus TaxID=392827 RepID=UPI0006863A8E|nr:hypothetical protein [Halalkalibacillus halophilus]